jgi:hypothetical protein
MAIITMNEVAPSIVSEVDALLFESADEWLTFDRKLAAAKGYVILRWQKTGVPISIPLEISQKALDKGQLHMGELRRVLKRYLPPNVLRQLISDANILLRGASRRDLKQVQQDFREWIDHAASQLRLMFGSEISLEFLKLVDAPTGLKRGSIQELQFLIETHISRLNDI